MFLLNYTIARRSETGSPPNIGKGRIMCCITLQQIIGPCRLLVPFLRARLSPPRARGVQTGVEENRVRATEPKDSRLLRPSLRGWPVKQTGRHGGGS